MKRIGLLESFVSVVHAGGFTAASRQLSASRATLWRQVVELEEQMGARLIQRSTRAFRVTAEGQALFDSSFEAVEKLQQALEAQLSPSKGLRGIIKVSAPAALGSHVIVPMLAAFAVEHPRVELVIECGDRQVNLIDEGFDIAVRMGRLADSQLHARVIGESTPGLYASPRYLRAAAPLTVPADLASHRLVAGPGPGQTGTWQLRRRPDGGEETVHFKPALWVSPLDAVLSAVEHGLGIAWLPDFLATSRPSESLVRVLPDWMRSPSLLNLVTPTARGRSTRVQVCLDYLTRKLEVHFGGPASPGKESAARWHRKR